MLNENQKKAVLFGNGPALVLAGPGSGKTTVITRRIASLISRGIDPSTILVITFTKAAAVEMQKRFLAICGPGGGSVNFGTFHSIFYHILCREYHYRPEDILNHSTKEKILKNVLRRMWLSVCGDDCLERIFSAISQVKNGKLNLDSISEKEYENTGERPLSLEEFRIVYREYCLSLDKNRLIDFDDMVVKAYELLKTSPNVLSYWQGRFKYILVDEFQDISPMQYEVVKLLAAPENNLFIVGDDDQSIYGFRGSDPEIMMGFMKDHPGAERIDLDINYRCSKEIVDGSIKVINNNKTRFNKNIKPCKEASNISIDFIEHADPGREARALCELMQNDHEKGGIPYSDMAVLYRNHNIADKLKETLISSDIPVNIKEKPVNIYRSDIVCDILSYISISQGTGSRADYINVLNKPDRGLLRQALDDENPGLETMRDYYKGDILATREIDKWEMLNKNMIKLTPYGALGLIRYGLGYDEHLRDREEREGRRAGDLCGIYDKIMDESKNYNTISQFLKFVAKKKGEEERPDDAGTKKDGVNLYTLHGSKGLEFRIVYIIEVNEGIIPQNRDASQGVVEEERRLFYVGMTRAKEKLVLSFVRRRGGKELIPSRFIDEIRRDREAGQSKARP